MALAQADLDYVRALIRSESGMVLSEEKRYLVEARLRAVAAREGVGDMGTLVSLVRAPDAHALRDRVVQGVLIGETQFFRDVHPFEALRDHIVPELIRGRESDRVLNIWCAASSSGQEPYSVALILAEHFPRLATWRVKLLASDLSEHMLLQARAGLYSAAEIGRGLPPEMLARQFERQGEQWLLSERIRRRVEFQRINLVGDWPALPRMDLVLMRNVLIYFDAPTRARIVAKVRDLLRPGGYLCFGTSESMDLAAQGFAQVRLGRTICYRRSTSLPKG